MTSNPPTVTTTATAATTTTNNQAPKNATTYSTTRTWVYKTPPKKRTYYDVDLSKYENTKAGYLPPSPTKQDKEQQPIRKQRYVPQQPPINFGEENPVCEQKDCGSIELDWNLKRHYGVNVCESCAKKETDTYSLLTKTEVKLDYLLTDSELRDKVALPHMDKPNPLQSHYSDMQLYLRKQCEAFAINKWGSLEELDKEFERRAAAKTGRKQKKFDDKLDELRRQTRTEEWHKARAEKARIKLEGTLTTSSREKQQISGGICKHFFTGDADKKKCKHCGIVIEEEEL